MNRICSIYIISNSINDKVYVGQTWLTIHGRFRSHKQASHKGCVKLFNAFNKHGKEIFTIECITTCSDQFTADYLENFWINTYDSITNGYNVRGGGSHGRWSEDMKRQMSKTHTGKVLSEHHKKQISTANQGKASPMAGKKHLDISKSKMSDSHKGIVQSEETISKRLPYLIGNTFGQKHFFSEDQILNICNDIRSDYKIAIDYNVSRKTISRLKKKYSKLIKDNSIADKI